MSEVKLCPVCSQDLIGFVVKTRDLDGTEGEVHLQCAFTTLVKTESPYVMNGMVKAVIEKISDRMSGY